MASGITSRVHPSRAVAATAGLALTGAVSGAAVSTVVVLAVSAALGSMVGGAVVATAAVVGGGLGALLVPITAWTLLRRVPIGRAVAATLAGAVAGGALVVLLAGINPAAIGLGSTIGFGLAALRLHRRFRSPAIQPTALA